MEVSFHRGIKGDGKCFFLLHFDAVCQEKNNSANQMLASLQKSAEIEVGSESVF